MITDEGPTALLALLEGCANPGVTRHALLLRPAALPPDLRRPHHQRLIEAALDPLRNLDRAGFYRLADGTIVVAWRRDGHDAVRAAVAALEKMFADLAERPFALLDLPADSAVVAAAMSVTAPRGAPAADAGTPLTPAVLAALEAALLQADVAIFNRRQSICGWPADGKPVLAWERRFLSPTDIAASLAPGVDIQSEPWLFRRLTRSFDRRLLALLSDPAELRQAVPFGLDLNLASIVGPEFVRFDAVLPSHLRGHVVLGVAAADMLAEAAGFAFARDFARARGYRLLLRGLSPAWLHRLDLAAIDLDYVEIDSRAEGWADIPRPLAAVGVLTGIEDPMDVAVARREGFGLFEGPAVRVAFPVKRVRRRREKAFFF